MNRFNRLPSATDNGTQISFEITKKNNKLSLLCIVQATSSELRTHTARNEKEKGKIKRLNEKYNLCVGVWKYAYGITKVIKFDKSQAMTSCIRSSLTHCHFVCRRRDGSLHQNHHKIYSVLYTTYNHHSQLIRIQFRRELKPIYNRFGTEHKAPRTENRKTFPTKIKLRNTNNNGAVYSLYSISYINGDCRLRIEN